MYRWIVFIHVFSSFTFIMIHGVTSLVSFRLRTERNLDAIRGMLSLYASPGAFSIMYLSLLLLLGAGIWAGFQGSWWDWGWIWLALGLLIAVSVAMYLVGTKYYTKVRKAVGMPYMEGNKQMPAEAPLNDKQIDELLSRSPAVTIAVIGIGGIALILWLMMFKPF
jgi:hypothetical protein